MTGTMILDRAAARAYLLGHLGLTAPLGRGARGVRATLARLGCIQLDPLDPMGTNADLVALARVDGLAVGDVYRHLLGGHAFEHYAQERCLLPAEAFPYYRDRGNDTHWWSHQTRLERVPPRVVEAVLAEVSLRGPISAAELTDHGAVEPIDWSGWQGTAKATRMALEILWTRCQVVIAGRRGREKVYDVPGRALPAVADAPGGDFARWALVHRVRAAGLMTRAAGPIWSMLSQARADGLADRLVEEGVLEAVQVEGSPRPYLALAGFRRRRFPADDGRLRLLGPLDPLLWDRKLVAHLFDFDYVWEVYKPPAERRWGWYVHPLLHRGRLVGRLEGRLEDDALVIERLWPEPGRFPHAALDDALERHAAACGVRRFRRPRRRSAILFAGEAPGRRQERLAQGGSRQGQRPRPLRR